MLNERDTKAKQRLTVHDLWRIILVPILPLSVQPKPRRLRAERGWETSVNPLDLLFNASKLFSTDLAPN